MKPFYITESACDNNLYKIAIKLEAYDYMKAFPKSSYSFLIARILGINYGDLCRYCREKCEAVLIKGGYISIVFNNKNNLELIKLVSILNNRFNKLYLKN